MKSSSAGKIKLISFEDLFGDEKEKINIDDFAESYYLAKQMIKTELEDTAASFVAIGYYLRGIESSKAYEKDGYASIGEFAKQEFGMSKPSTSKCISVNKKFSENGYSPLVDEKYKDFSKTQMQEMITFDTELIEQVEPEMPVAKIRGIGKTAKHIKSKLAEEDQIIGQADIMTLEDGKYMPENISTSKQEKEKTIEITKNNEPMEAYESENVVAESEYREMVDVIQPELPVLKNMDQRKAFIEMYESWPLWISIDQTGEKYYRYKLPEEVSIVVKTYKSNNSYFNYELKKYVKEEHYGYRELYLLRPGKYFKDCESNMSIITEYLKDIQKIK